MAKWQWYDVKLVYEFILTGQPDHSCTDQAYSDELKTYEESIVLVKAQSFEHAYTVAGRLAKKAEMEYQNPFGELVKYRFIDAIDCFLIYDAKLETGTELYSRYIHMPKHMNIKEFLDRCYPELKENKPTANQCWRLRVKEFN